MELVDGEEMTVLQIDFGEFCLVFVVRLRIELIFMARKCMKIR